MKDLLLWPVIATTSVHIYNGGVAVSVGWLFLISRFVKLILWSELTIMHEIPGLACLFSAGFNY